MQEHVARAAIPVADQPVAVKTPDGEVDAVLVHPIGEGAWPGVIWYPDAFGLRPTMVEMARRLAGEGYVVLVVNPFYRIGRAPVLPPSFNLADPGDRAWLLKMIGELDHAKVTSDAKAFVSFLDAQPQVSKTRRIGAIGFCMGGSMTIRAAAAAPERMGAAVSFHGGRLVTDDPDSPHRLVGGTRATYHIGISQDDDAEEPHAKVEMKAALEAASLSYTQEIYEGADHGWTVPDSAVYNEPQAERAWATLLATYRAGLA